MRSPSLIFVPALACLFVASCAAPVVVIGAGLSAAQAGTAAFVRGELTAAYPAEFTAVADAAGLALEGLGFTIGDSSRDERQAWYSSRELGGRGISVIVEACSPAVTEVRIRVGTWGDQPLSRLILARMEAELDHPEWFGPGQRE